nr:mesotocin [Setonix brachyurus]
CYFQNCPIG